MDLFRRILIHNQTQTIEAFSKMIYPDDYIIDDEDEEENCDNSNDEDKEETLQSLRENYKKKYDKSCYHQFRKTKAYHVGSYREEMKYFQRKNPELAFKF